MKRFINNHLFFSLLSIALFLLYGVGGFLTKYLISVGYDKEYSPVCLWQACGFFALFGVAYFLATVSLSRRSGRFAHGVSKKISILPLALSLGAVVAYFAQNGLLLFQSGGYEDRYSANIGLGLWTLLMQMFYLYVAGMLYRVGPIKAKALLVQALIFFAVTFIVMGGYRQLGAGVVVGLLLFLLLEEKISGKIFVFLSLGALVLTLFIAVFRYQSDSFGAQRLVDTLVMFFYDGLTPVDAHANIVRYLQFNRAPGLSLAVNQFAVYVPRALWEAKPVVVMNAGNFYTSVVLGRDSAITYSPTLLGALLLMGEKFIYFFALVCGWILALVDREIRCRSYLGIIFIVFSFTLIFNLYREGFFVFFTKSLIVFLFAFLFYVFARTGVGKKLSHPRSVRRADIGWKSAPMAGWRHLALPAREGRTEL